MKEIGEHAGDHDRKQHFDKLNDDTENADMQKEHTR